MKISASRQAQNTVTQLAEVTSTQGGAQLWIARPDGVAPDQWPVLEQLLDAEERTKASRFRVEADRRSYILAHALRRAVLALALRTDPHNVRISSDEDGRPVLESPRATPPVYFSHSRCRIAVALALAPAPVGVDIEAIAAANADFELLQPYFKSPRAAREAGPFFSWWTLLEAFWKAAGVGLDASNPRLCCRRNPEDGTVSVAIEQDSERALAEVLVLESRRDLTISLALGSEAIFEARKKPSLIHNGQALQMRMMNLSNSAADATGSSGL